MSRVPLIQNAYWDANLNTLLSPLLPGTKPLDDHVVLVAKG